MRADAEKTSRSTYFVETADIRNRAYQLMKIKDSSPCPTRREHTRHVVEIYPQFGVNGYVIAMDEFQGGPNITTGHLAWHPYSDEITFNSDPAQIHR